METADDGEILRRLGGDMPALQRKIAAQVERRLRRGDPDVEDVASEVHLILVMIAMQGEIGNLSGLVATVAQRRAATLIRRRQQIRAIESAFDSDPRLHQMLGPSAATGLFDQEYVQFLLHRLIEEAASESCRELARHRLAERPWDVVAQLLSESSEKLRKRWSECVKRLRRDAKNYSLRLWALLYLAFGDD